MKKSATPKTTLMYALVSYKTKTLCDQLGDFYTSLPPYGAWSLLFAHKADAERVQRRYIRPLLEIIEVDVDAKGFPTPHLDEMAKPFVYADWKASKNLSPMRTKPNAMGSAV